MGYLTQEDIDKIRAEQEYIKMVVDSALAAERARIRAAVEKLRESYDGDWFVYGQACKDILHILDQEGES